MYKKLFAFVAGAVFSLSASAGYVQYNFNGGPDSSGLSGYFIQRDDDQSIAFFDFRVTDYNAQPASGPYQILGASFFPNHEDGGVDLGGRPTTYFHADEPTNFSLVSNYGSDQTSHVSINFSRGTHGQFEYVATWDWQSWYTGIPDQRGTLYYGTVNGTVSKGTLLPGLEELLDGPYKSVFWVEHVVPQYISPAHVPEPASLALFAAGILGAVGASRRRRTAR